MNKCGKEPSLQDSPHLTQPEKHQLLEQLRNADEQKRYEIMTRLAWRPAWAIRSRRGAWTAVKKLFR